MLFRSTFSRLARAYRTMRGGDALFVLGTLLRDYDDLPGLDVPEPSPQTSGVHLADPATQARRRPSPRASWRT